MMRRNKRYTNNKRIRRDKKEKANERWEKV